MMTVRTFVATTAALLFAVMAAGSAEAGGPRQYYGSWQKQPTHGYYYRNLYYKPTPSYSGYKHHYVIYHPQRPKHYYFYNPYKKAYWGRCPTDYGDNPTYSMLPQEYRKPSLSDIPDSAFPPPAPVPQLSGVTDSERLDLPPDDLPPEAQGAPFVGPPAAAAAAPAP